jgi:hypothetical protein
MVHQRVDFAGAFGSQGGSVFQFCLEYMWSREGSQRDLLSKITGITDFHRFQTASIAQKMSWMANLHTTRIEDIAYCMLGLFGVYMPLLYGEGERAFYRLQLELLKISDDESLLAWSFNDENGMPATTGPLATSPAYFRSSGDIVRRHFSTGRPPLSMTARGLLFERFVTDYGVPLMFTVLNCRETGSPKPILIRLKLVSPWRPGDLSVYERIPDVGGCKAATRWGEKIPLPTILSLYWIPIWVLILISKVLLDPLIEMQKETFYVRDPEVNGAIDV